MQFTWITKSRIFFLFFIIVSTNNQHKIDKLYITKPSHISHQGKIISTFLISLLKHKYFLKETNLLWMSFRQNERGFFSFSFISWNSGFSSTRHVIYLMGKHYNNPQGNYVYPVHTTHRYFFSVPLKIIFFFRMFCFG